MSELQNGTVIKDKYEIVRFLRRGKLGEDIYLGHHKELDSDIFIKILPLNEGADKELRGRFSQNIRFTGNFKHPNILHALDAGSEDEFVFFVTYYEKGFFLDEYLEFRSVVFEQECMSILKELSDALEHVWNDWKIVHRNIAPDTILLAKGNRPMLMDFGLAKSLESDYNLTLSGYIVGDPAYMSPEQIRNEELDVRSDIYCLGVVLYELLSGFPPFQADGQTKLMHDQAYKQHQPLREKTRSISRKCESIIDKMLEKDKGKRFQSWGELKKAVEQYFNHANIHEKKEKQQKLIRIDKFGKSSTALLDNKLKNTSDVIQHRQSISLVALFFFVLNILLSAFLLFTAFRC